MIFDRSHFDSFCKSLMISSKEEGVITLGDHLLGTQRLFLKELQIGLEENIHEFVTLKCRQIGVSTISLALDLYWPMKHKGLNGALVVHDDPSRDQFRSTIEMYLDGLPDEWRFDVVQHNRNQLVFENQGRFQYKVAGLKEKSAKSLGRSSALTFLHATEVAFWGDPNQKGALKATLAERNPARLYHWETTANGFNHFHDQWKEAKTSTTQRAIFISFWANEYYRKDNDSIEYRTYWGKSGRLTNEEKDWIKQVKSLYGYEVDSQQVAWFRWMQAEKVTDEIELLQEFPPTEEHAFQATGSAFFMSKDIGEAYKRIIQEPKPEFFKLQVGNNFVDTSIVPCHERVANLKIWKHPEKNAMYVLGADPAFGSSENAADYACTVYRCWSNRMEQVAEFCAGDMETHSFAWVIVYLAGAYEPCVLNLEINGAGQATLKEIQNLKKEAQQSVQRAPHSKMIMDVLGSMRQYMYRRIDSISGIPTAMHTQTNLLVKERMLGDLKSYFSRSMLIPHSRTLIDQMKNVSRQGGAAPAAATGNDDLVMASALAVLAWNDQMRGLLINKGMIWRENQPADNRIIVPATGILSRNVQSYLKSIKVLREDEMRKQTTYIPPSRK